jgi:hypothetical protein
VASGLAAALAGPAVLALLACVSRTAVVLGDAGLTVALLRWRLVLALASATVVLLVLCVQYFAKLAGALHWGLLAVGFGLIVLFFATLYERKLKQLLPEWSRWD